MIRDYSKNSLAVREQREENVYLYRKGEGLEARFWCDFHRDLSIHYPEPQASCKEHGSNCANEVHCLEIL
jgi:hypothetical protein